MANKIKPDRTFSEVMSTVKHRVERRKRAQAKRAAEVAARMPCEGYEPCIVSFIDVLGFRDLLANRHAHDIRDVLLQLREFTAPSKGFGTFNKKDARLFSRAFVDSVSDAVVRVRVFKTEHSDGAFFLELLDLLHAQIQCVGNGVVVRGGVAIGDAHVGPKGKGPVFGPAMVRAYEIESSEAVYPRIVVEEAAYQCLLTDARLRKEDHSLEEEVSYVDRFLRLDADGKRYIDYLGASESEFDDLVGYFDFLEQHANLISGKLAATTGQVRAKFEWLTRYHNSVVGEILAEFDTGRRSVEGFDAEWMADPRPWLQRMIVED
ncbi:hypothetical protein FLX56_11290 [Synechococcus moorigangaii CMS01]|nr:hypothetical protein [Synechococcus moorigangaii CMS01]